LDQPIWTQRSVSSPDFRYIEQFLTGRPRTVPPTLLLIVAVTIVLATHFLEVVVWAIFYIQMDLLPELNRAMYFSMNSYSTPSASEIVLPMSGKAWRGPRRWRRG
jgi:hypothetical protein